MRTPRSSNATSGVSTRSSRRGSMRFATSGSQNAEEVRAETRASVELRERHRLARDDRRVHALARARRVLDDTRAATARRRTRGRQRDASARGEIRRACGCGVAIARSAAARSAAAVRAAPPGSVAASGTARLGSWRRCSPPVPSRTVALEPEQQVGYVVAAEGFPVGPDLHNTSYRTNPRRMI